MLNILYEDNDILVLNKPSGIAVHPAPGVDGATLADELIVERPQLKGVGEDENRPGIVHRLDKDVSGVMVIAKTQEAYTFLKQQFLDRTLEKEYVALVHGKLPKETDTIRVNIGRSARKARMAARPTSQEGREAITHYEILERFRNFDLIRVKIETGRTHQIRASFHFIGHPIAGDELYFVKRFKIFAIGRPFLHARSLTLNLLNGERRTFSAPLPEELTQAIKKIAHTKYA